MIIKEYTGRDTQGKSRLYVDMQCPVCQKIKTAQKRQVKDYFCSRKCRNLIQGTRIVQQCAQCLEELELKSSRLKYSKSGKVYCSVLCHNRSMTEPTNYRKYALAYYENKCNRCGFDDIRAIQVHHIDRNRMNNSIENLEVLCCNCHSIEHS